MFEKTLKIISVLLIINSLLMFSIYIIVDKKLGGNVLNCQQIENEYVIANRNGDIKKVSKKIWWTSYILTFLLFIMVILGILSIFYLFIRYAFMSNIIRVYKILKNK